MTSVPISLAIAVDPLRGHLEGSSASICVIFATLQNFCNSIIAPTYFSYWLSQFDHQQGVP